MLNIEKPVYYVKNIVHDGRAVCRCGCRGFVRLPLNQEMVFVCIYCFNYLSIYDTGEYIEDGIVPEDLLTLMGLVQDKKTILEECNGTMGRGWYSKDNNDFNIAEAIYQAGFRKVED